MARKAAQLKRDGSRFVKAADVLAIAYRDKDGDFLHRFKKPCALLTNPEGDLVLLRGGFKFASESGFIDKGK